MYCMAQNPLEVTYKVVFRPLELAMAASAYHWRFRRDFPPILAFTTRYSLSTSLLLRGQDCPEMLLVDLSSTIVALCRYMYRLGKDSIIISCCMMVPYLLYSEQASVDGEYPLSKLELICER